jgi:hypothetical protein
MKNLVVHCTFRRLLRKIRSMFVAPLAATRAIDEVKPPASIVYMNAF